MDCCKILDPGVYVDIILTYTAYLTSLQTWLTPVRTSPKQVLEGTCGAFEDPLMTIQHRLSLKTI